MLTPLLLFLQQRGVESSPDAVRNGRAQHVAIQRQVPRVTASVHVAARLTAATSVLHPGHVRRAPQQRRDRPHRDRHQPQGIDVQLAARWSLLPDLLLGFRPSVVLFLFKFSSVRDRHDLRLTSSVRLYMQIIWSYESVFLPMLRCQLICVGC